MANWKNGFRDRQLDDSQRRWKRASFTAVRRGFVPEKVWVSSALPLLVFVTAGFFATLTLGDLVLWVVYGLLG